MKIAVLGAP